MLIRFHFLSDVTYCKNSYINLRKILTKTYKHREAFREDLKAYEARETSYREALRENFIKLTKLARHFIAKHFARQISFARIISHIIK